MLFGSPGSGKGTQAELLSREFNIPIISPGQLYREAAANKTPLGIEARDKYWGKGKLCPDEITIKITREGLEKDDCKKGFILDGFPRTIVQAEALKKIAKIDYIFNIKVSKEELAKRMAARRSCGCGEWFDLRVKPPKDDEICDKCGKKLVIREDDKPKVVKKRFEVYKKQTMPLLDFYEDKVIDINGEQPMEDVFKDIKNNIKP